MSKRTGKTRKPRQKNAPPPPGPEPVDAADGIPDRGAGSTWRRLVWVLLIFAAWAAFLVYCQVAGSS